MKETRYQHIENSMFFSWECQVLDTDFHFLKNIENGTIYDRQKKSSLAKACSLETAAL